MFPSASSESRRSRLGLGALAAVVLVAPSVAVAQLVNPSFETPGAGTHFDGWGQFGNVAGASDLTADGVRAAKIWGPFHGNWAVSGIYQDLPAEPGWVFEASVYAGHSGADPITGDARAILNVEWRDAIGGLISYETVDLVGASDPTGVMGLYEHSTGPAPTGTTAARLLLGFLQSPANETGSCRFDLASFARNPDAEHDALQWVDFGDRTIDFSGRSWRCKVGASMGPGPNRFSDSTENVWVDAQGHLHMAVTFDGADWACPEIALEDALGHGDYVFVTRGRVDELDPNHVLGMFLWEYQESYEGSNEFNVANEFDVELSRWGDAATALNSQFVAQPWHAPGNRSRFPLTLDSPDALATHAFLWRDGQVVCRAWHGSAPAPTSETLIHEFNYTGADVPRDEAPRVHINFWLIWGDPPLDGQDREIVIEEFRFVPASACPGDLDGDDDTDVFDFGVLAASFGSAVPALTSGDYDGDSDVDVFDFGVLASDFGCGPVP